MRDYVYLDNNATTRPREEVVAAMQPLLAEAYANPSSTHQFGQSVRHRLECARTQVADLLHADPNEVVFTSGGTESINLAVRGVLAGRSGPSRIVMSAVEHPAVRRIGRQLIREGGAVDEVGVDREGRLDLAELAAKVTPDTALVSLIWVNNETGIISDVEAVARIAADRGVPVHLDAVQAAGKVPIDVQTLPVQLLSISAHKFHGPKGVGALFVRRRTRLSPLILGGRQERDLRGGTENVPGIVGLGMAAEMAGRQGLADVPRIAVLRDRLEEGILQGVSIARVNGAGASRVANTTSIAFRGLPAEAILLLLSEGGVCVSAGSACSSGSLEPSHVLQAMAVEPEYAHGSIRFSLSSFTTAEEVDRAVRMMPEVAERLAGLAR
jgi:cysteine desulfurase